MAKTTVIDVEYLRNVLDYDHESGVLTWKHRPDARPQWTARWAGKPALTWVNQSGYPCGRVNYVGLLAHRVAYAIYHGEWPEAEIDHINGDPSDYRIENLRPASRQENMRNTRIPSTNTSGVIGVSWYKPYGMWTAAIMVNRKNIRLGYFRLFDEAVTARKAAECTFGFHENHGRA